MARGIRDLRQLLHPREFRIPPGGMESDAAESLVGIIDEVRRAVQAIAHTGTQEVTAPTFTDATIADVGTGLWRLRQKMVEPGTDRPVDSMRRAFRHMESVWDVLTEVGVEVQDHTGHPFDSGMSLKVIAFQSEADVSRERIAETVKPSIYIGDRRIQMGEVIVATPEGGSGEGR